MKILHLSDLHLGKRYNEYSFIEDQEHILKQVLQRIDEEKPQLVLIAGDVYDRSIPSEEAVRLFDEFLVQLLDRNLEIAVSSGNHDSAERLAFGNRIFPKNLHISSVYRGKLETFRMQDAHGDVDVYLLPFVKPAHVKAFFPEAEITSYTDAIRVALQEVPQDSVRKILVAHQFVTGAMKSESEEINVGTLDNVDVNVFDAFDYVALGHIHRAQSIGREGIRYCGTVLKYNISEANQEKSVCFVNLEEKGNLSVYSRPLQPKRDMVKIEKHFEQILQDARKQQNHEDYTYITLNDEQEVPNAFQRLREYFPNILGMAYNNTRTRAEKADLDTVIIEEKSPYDLVKELFQKMNGQSMNQEQSAVLRDSIEQVWGNQA